MFASDVRVPANTGGKFVVLMRKSWPKETAPLLAIVPQAPYTSIQELFVSLRRSYHAAKSCVPSGLAVGTPSPESGLPGRSPLSGADNIPCHDRFAHGCGLEGRAPGDGPGRVHLLRRAAVSKPSPPKVSSTHVPGSGTTGRRLKDCRPINGAGGIGGSAKGLTPLRIEQRRLAITADPQAP